MSLTGALPRGTSLRGLLLPALAAGIAAGAVSYDRLNSQAVLEDALPRGKDWVDRHDLGAIVLRRPANFAWYTGGADSRVDHVAPDGVADIVLTATDEWVLTSTIEAPRMRAEQTPALEVVEGFGAQAWVAQCEAELARLGRFRPGTLELTPTEQADMVVFLTTQLGLDAAASGALAGLATTSRISRSNIRANSKPRSSCAGTGLFPPVP